MAEPPAATDTPLISLEGAVIDWPGSAGVGPFDLTISPGEIVAVVGASGVGKSSLLRLICGLEQAAGGRATRRVAPGRIGFVFQNPVLAPWSDVAANVALPLRLAGVAGAEIDRRVCAILADVGLAERSTARPRELSGGMAMRASLARALVIAPELLLLDEPFAALDSVTRRRMAALVHALWAGKGDGAPRPAVVFVTHDIEEAVFFARRVVVLGPGGVVLSRPCPGDLPRPDGWRASASFRAAVEQLADDLAGTMEERA